MRPGRLLLTADAVGGVWQYSTELAAALQPFGYDVTLAVMGPGLSDAQRAAADAIPNVDVVETGLELEWLATGPAPIIAAQDRLARMAADWDADILQLHSPALVGAGPQSCPTVAVLHSCVATWWSAVREGPMPHDFHWRAELVREGLQRATLAVAPSRAFADAAQRQYGVAPVPVHNGRALTVTRAPMQDFVLTTGRLWDEGKNVAILDRAAAGIDLPFFAAGPLRAPHGQRIDLKALRPLGTLDAAGLAQHLSARPVFASAALYEPFGLSVLEAAMAGCALVLSDIPTFRELWDGAALFVDPRDPDAFARTIQGLIATPAHRIDAGRRAEERARRYHPAAMAATMADHYARIARKVAA